MPNDKDINTDDKMFADETGNLRISLSIERVGSDEKRALGFEISPGMSIGEIRTLIRDLYQSAEFTLGLPPKV